MKPKLLMLVGIPASGKSTYARQHLVDGTVVLSTDDYIQDCCEMRGISYNAGFEEFIGEAVQQLNADLRNAIACGHNIIWDQTNLTPRSRKRKLGKVPSSYEKIVVFFNTKIDECIARNANRAGKLVPRRVLVMMHEQLVKPTMAEGFDSVIVIKP